MRIFSDKQQQKKKNKIFYQQHVLTEGNSKRCTSSSEGKLGRSEMQKGMKSRENLHKCGGIKQLTLCMKA